MKSSSRSKHKYREQPRLNEMVEEYECGDYVRLLGFQPESELPTYMAMVDIGVSPLKRNPHHDTTHANKLFQFMLGGLPLIVSDCTAQANLISDYELGVVFEADKDSSFIQAIQQVYLNEGNLLGDSQNEKSSVSSVLATSFPVTPDLFQCYNDSEKCPPLPSPTSIRPPWYSSMMRLQRDRPRPQPRALVV